MGSLKTLALAGAMAVGAFTAAKAADFPLAPPPPPPPEPVALRGAVGGGWYLRGDVGVGAQSYDKLDVTVNGVNPAVLANVTSFRTVAPQRSVATFAGLGVGYQFNSWLRVDVTGEYRGAAFNGRDHVGYLGGGGIPVQQINNYRADIATFVGLVNAYVDLGTWNCLTPYLGAGIGFANHRINGFTDTGLNRPAGQQFDNISYAYGDSASKTNLAWALMAGVSYDVTSNLKLDVGYRYLNMGDGPSIGLNGAAGALVNPSSAVRFKRIDSHDFRIGMRWNFNDPNCCGVKEQPVAYEPAPHVIRKY
jgi:opacity protein-like surface antigen